MNLLTRPGKFNGVSMIRSITVIIVIIVTAHNVVREGNVFICVCLSVHSRGSPCDRTCSKLFAWKPPHWPYPLGTVQTSSLGDLSGLLAKGWLVFD